MTYLSLTEAADESGLSAGTLRVLLNSGRLKGSKRGRDWSVTRAELDTYLDSRAPAGRPAFTYKARRNRPMMLASDEKPNTKHSFFAGAATGGKQRVAKSNPRVSALSAKTARVKKGFKAAARKK